MHACQRVALRRGRANLTDEMWYRVQIPQRMRQNVQVSKSTNKPPYSGL